MLTIKEVQSMCGISASALRYYETEGLLFDISRDDGGRRLYSKKQVEWLRFILALKATGMSIQSVKDYLELVLKEGMEYERREFLVLHKQKVEQQIADLFLNLEKINRKIAYYDATILNKPYI